MLTWLFWASDLGGCPPWGDLPVAHVVWIVGSMWTIEGAIERLSGKIEMVGGI